MKSFKRFLTVLEKSRAVFLLLGKGVKMEMPFTEHFQDVLQEYKKVFMEVTGIDESLIDDESLILGDWLTIWSVWRKPKDLVYLNKNE